MTGTGATPTRCSGRRPSSSAERLPPARGERDTCRRWLRRDLRHVKRGTSQEAPPCQNRGRPRAARRSAGRGRRRRADCRHAVAARRRCPRPDRSPTPVEVSTAVETEPASARSDAQSRSSPPCAATDTGCHAFTRPGATRSRRSRCPAAPCRGRAGGRRRSRRRPDITRIRVATTHEGSQTRRRLPSADRVLDSDGVAGNGAQHLSHEFLVGLSRGVSRGHLRSV